MEEKRKKKRGKSDLLPLGGMLDKYRLEDKGGYVTREFQDYGYRLAMELGDEKHKSLYMRLAKKEDRVLLEKALSFVKDAKADKPGALFMWKLKQLKGGESSQGLKGRGGVDILEL